MLRGGREWLPAKYQVKLIVDWSDSERVAACTNGSDARRRRQMELKEQQRLGLEIYTEALRSAKALADAKAAQADLAKLTMQLKKQPQLQATGRKSAGGNRPNYSRKWRGDYRVGGCQRWVAVRIAGSGGWRPPNPQQALEVYRLSDAAAKSSDCRVGEIEGRQLWRISIER